MINNPVDLCMIKFLSVGVGIRGLGRTVRGERVLDRDLLYGGGSSGASPGRAIGGMARSG
jgi:hypothetical protein